MQHLKLPKRFSAKLTGHNESGMGYHIVTVVLKDGRAYEQTVVVEGSITHIRFLKKVPFEGTDIAKVTVSHDRWDFSDGT